MDHIQRLTELFREFPGIGPRQAKRFVYFLLAQNSTYSSDLAREIAAVQSEVATCNLCQRFFPRGATPSMSICPVCADNRRDKTQLMIVSHDIDFENIEKSKSYTGYYFILGGTVPILEKNPERRIRQSALLETLGKRVSEGLTELIIATSYNPEGENTLSYVSALLRPLSEQHGIKISALGRGLSTGTELEYSDPETIKNALQNRR